MLSPQIQRRNDQTFAPEPMNRLDLPLAGPLTDWLWHGLIARKNLTLLTSQWKAGKTTLITGLLQQYAAGGSFLDRPVAPAKVLVVSEEARDTWAERLQRMPVGEHCRLLSRPFLRRPTPQLWAKFVDYAVEQRLAGDLDLLVIDPLARFIPGTDGDLNALLEMLDPLQPLMEAGAGVLILHHPRKKRSEEGNTARGSGGLLAAVDIIVELSSLGPLRTDERRRKLYAVSRYPETPRRWFYDWDPATGRFKTLTDPHGTRFQENWPHIEAILQKRKLAATHLELLADWPPDHESPSRQMLYHWLNRAHEEKRVRRIGGGTKDDPYRFRLSTADDEYWDRGDVPPLRDKFTM
jgi:hypothetical protein